jgi:PiT family inorganic phosphate transporter
MPATFILITVALIAYANGANATFKGVASLYGSGTTSYRNAMHWAVLTTAAGAVASVWFAAQLLKAFSGKGLVPDALVVDPVFLLSVAVGAMLTGGAATWLGFPVSTTHALIGGLLGAGLRADPAHVDFGKLGTSFGLPLLLGPAVAILLGSLFYLILRGLQLAPDHRTKTGDTLHFLSAGAVCFARGMNDTPKMAALLAGSAAMPGSSGLWLVGLAMTAGGIIGARKVAETLAHKITGMDPGQGFAANLTTSILVILGSIKGLPLSTTHVTVGSLLGIGITTRQARWRTVIPVLLAWIITLPCAALLAAITFSVMRLFTAPN